MVYDYSQDEVGPLQDRTLSASPSKPSRAKRAPSAPTSRDQTLARVLWPVYILFRPRVFFESLAMLHAPSLTFSCAMMFGMSNTIDRVSNKMGTTGISVPWETSWGAFWGFVVGAGAVSAALTYVIGGWWYRRRLRWCGVADPDKKVSTRIYVCAAQVFATPSVLMTAIAGSVFATPLEAAESDAATIWGLISIVLVLWSFAVSYIGVRTVFAARVWPARIWFLILPVGFVIAMVVIGLGLLIAFDPEAP